MVRAPREVPRDQEAEEREMEVTRVLVWRLRETGEESMAAMEERAREKILDTNLGARGCCLGR